MVCSVVSPPTGGENNGTQPPRRRTHGTQTHANNKTPERRRTTAGRTAPEPTSRNQPGTAEAGTQTQRGDHQRHTGKNGDDDGNGKNREPRGDTTAAGRGNRTNRSRRSPAKTDHHKPNRAGRAATATTPTQQPNAAKTTPTQPPTNSQARNSDQADRKTEEENRKNNTRNTPKEEAGDDRTGTEPRRSTPIRVAEHREQLQGRERTLDEPTLVNNRP